MKSLTFGMKNIIFFTLSSLLFINCSTEEINDGDFNELNTTSSNQLTISNNSLIALYGVGGYLSADAAYLKCNRSSVSDDGERFLLTNNSDGTISLKSVSTGRYVSSEINRSYGMTANRTAIGAWEKFQLYDLGNNQVALSNTYQGVTKYVCSEGGRTDTYCNRNSVAGAWEKFTLTIEDNNDDSNTGSSLDGNFTLSDFQIETSWLTGENSRTTNSFTATSKDNEDWYDKSGSMYWLKALKTDGNRTEWKERPGKEASLYTYKKMQYEAKVESIPENGVTIAQVHNRHDDVNRPLLRVYIDDDRKIKIKVTTTDPSASSSSYSTITGPTYSSGSTYTVEMTLQSGRVAIAVNTTNGSLNRTITPSSDWNDFDEDYYLKAGVYTEGNDTNPKITFNYFVVDK